MTPLKRNLLLLVSAGIMTACGGSSTSTIDDTTETNNTLQVINEATHTPQATKAIDKIIAYANSNGVTTTPTLEDYKKAGVSSVTAENLNEVNTIIKDFDKEDVNSAIKIENILKDRGVDRVNIQNPTINNPIEGVSDTTPPVIILIGKSNIILSEDTEYSDAGATASDDRDGNITNTIIKTGTVNTSVAGTYVIKYNVSDKAGNKANQIIRTIIIQHKIIPAEKAIAQIAAYADDNSKPVPTLQTYRLTEVSGVSNENVSTINSLVEELSYKDVDTQSELQALVDRVFYNTYYVSLNGSDSNTGTKQSPWRSVRYAVSKLDAGDILLIRKGLYRESDQINFFKGGTADKPILIKSYPNEEVIITSMIDASSPLEWTKVQGNIYKWNKVYKDGKYSHISIDGIPLRLKIKYNLYTGTASDITKTAEWSRKWTKKMNDAEVWVSSTNGANPGTQKIEISRRYSTFEVRENAHHIIFDNITVEGSYYPIEVRGDYITIKNSTFRNCFGDAVKVAGWLESETGKSTPYDSQHGKIINNEIYHFGEQGIDITGGDYWLVKGNNIHDGVANRRDDGISHKVSGIIMKNHSVGNLVTGNKIHDFRTVMGAVMMGGSSNGSTKYEGENLKFNNNEVYNLTGSFIVSFMACKDCSMEDNYIHDNNTLVGKSFNKDRMCLVELRNHDVPNRDKDGVYVTPDHADHSDITTTGARILRNRFENNIQMYKYKETYSFKGSNDEINATIDYNTGEIQSYFDGDIMPFEEVQQNKKYDIHLLN